jgi:hypothetical protein
VCLKGDGLVIEKLRRLGLKTFVAIVVTVVLESGVVVVVKRR